MLNYLEYGAKGTVVKIANSENSLSVNISGNTEKSLTLNKDEANAFLSELTAVGIETIFPSFIPIGEFEKGDGYHLVFQTDEFNLNFTGPEPEKSVLIPYLSEIMELLDKFFGTSFVATSRIDRIVVSFKNAMKIPFSQVFSSLGDTSHTEILSLDRESWTLSYKRRFPEHCFHNTFECHCENQIRQILDQSEQFLKNHPVSDVTINEDNPVVRFSFIHHDGRCEDFTRNLSNGTMDPLLDALMCAILETLKFVLISGGLFDPYTNFIDWS